VTGASGCIGHYVVEALIQETNHELYLLVRNPDKLKFDCQARPGITVIPGDLRQIEQFSDLLKTMDSVIHIATAWGGPQEVHEINVVKSLEFMKLLDPDRCQQVIYFSTASILDRSNQPLPQAGEIGSDYIRSKYECYQQLAELAIAPRITTLFPTLLLGGDANHPQSHLSSGVAQVAQWAWLLRFLQADGSFHFIHAKDVAQIVTYLIDHPPTVGEPRQLVLGNPYIKVNQAIEEACQYLNKRIYVRIPLTVGLANFFIALFQIKMSSWDRFCMEYRHSIHQNPITPESFGLPIYCATFTDILRLSGVPPGQRRSP